MKLRYGFNEIDGWWHISKGEHRDELRRRLRLMGTKVIRVFVFDQPGPDPVNDWHLFAALVEAILDGDHGTDRLSPPSIGHTAFF